MNTEWQRIAHLEAGRHAAMTRRGIEWRTPHMLAMQRFRALCKAADPSALRRYACDQAAALLPLIAHVYPEDHRPAVALETARRYAAGTATEAERKAAVILMKSLCRELEHDTDARIPYSTASAVGFCLWRRPFEGIEWTLYWGAVARGMDGHAPDRYTVHFAALEAMHSR